MDIISNDSLRIALTPYAAAVHNIYSLKLKRDLTFSLPDERSHLTDPSYSGNTIGAYAGRIRGSRLIIDGICYALQRNEGENSLHGGHASLRKLWERTGLDAESVTYETGLSHLEDGLPGMRHFKVAYKLTGDSFSITVSGESDRPTYLNLTNHTYFRINTGPELDDSLSVKASSVVVNDEAFLPSGLIPLRKPVALTRIPESLNNAFSLDGGIELESPDVKVTMLTDAPAAVIYSGFYLPSPAIAIEPQGPVLFSSSVKGALSYHLSISYHFAIRYS